MAFSNLGPCITVLASTGLRQYQAVDINSAGVLVNPSTYGEAIGILTSSGTTGSTGIAGSTTSGSVQEVQLYGVAKVLAGSTAVATGDFLKAGTAGLVTPATGTDVSASTSFLIGRALGSASSTSIAGTTDVGSGEVIPVLIMPLGGKR